MKTEESGEKGFTKKGHRLEQDADNPMIFRCRSRAVYHRTDAFQSSDEHLLAAILIYAPCTLGQVIATLRAWLGAYADDELVEQIDGVVEKAINGLTRVPTPTPSTQPPAGQGRGQGWN